MPFLAKGVTISTARSIGTRIYVLDDPVPLPTLTPAPCTPGEDLNFVD